MKLIISESGQGTLAGLLAFFVCSCLGIFAWTQIQSGVEKAREQSAENAAFEAAGKITVSVTDYRYDFDNVTDQSTSYAVVQVVNDDSRPHEVCVWGAMKARLHQVQAPFDDHDMWWRSGANFTNNKCPVYEANSTTETRIEMKGSFLAENLTYTLDDRPVQLCVSIINVDSVHIPSQIEPSEWKLAPDEDCSYYH